MSIDSLITALRETGEAGGGQRPAASLTAELARLAARRPTRKVACQQLLGLLCQSFRSPFAALTMRHGPDILDEEHHRGPTDPAFWRGPLLEFLTESLKSPAGRAQVLSARQASLKIALVAAPLLDEKGQRCGAVALVIPCSREALAGVLAELESAAAVVGALFFQPAAGAAGSVADANALSRASGAGSPVEFAFQITNTLRTKLGCEQVALGLVRRGEVTLLSISGLDDIRSQSPGVLAIQAAMEECYDAGTMAVMQDEAGFADDRASTGHLLHKRWHALAGGAAVATLPLPATATPVALISLRARPGDNFTPGRLREIQQLVAPYAPALELLRRANRGLFEHVLDAGYALSRFWLAPGRVGRKLAAAAVLLLAIWFCFGTLPYELRVRGAIQARNSRNVSMPMDGRLTRIARNVGDFVRAGDVLCVVDAREYELQRDALRAEAAAEHQKRLAALAADKPVEARLAEANETLLRAKVALMEERIDRCQVRSTIDGQIIRGDLRPKINNALPQGEPLYEIAPVAGRTIELEVPDRLARDLRTGIQGRFASAAQADRVHSFSITRIRPQAELREQDNVYIAEAELSSSVEWMRPGLEGVARLQLGRRPVWWLTFHEFLDYLRLNFWL